MAHSNRNITSRTPSLFEVDHALITIRDQYGDECYIGPRVEINYGRNEDLNTSTFETIWTVGGTETYVAGNDIDAISSGDAGDTQAIEIEGHTIDGNGDFRRVTQTATLNGQNKVTLDTPLARVNGAFNDSGTALAGIVYIYEDGAITAGVPDVASTIHLEIRAGVGESEKAAGTCAFNEYLIVTELVAGGTTKQSANIDVVFESKAPGKVFRRRFLTPTATGRSTVVQIDPPFIIPPNGEFRLNAKASAAGAEVVAEIGGYVAIVKGTT